MPDLSINTAAVALGSGSARVQQWKAGQDFSEGQPYYIASTSGVNSAYFACNTGVDQARARGVSLTSASSGSYFLGVNSGPISLGAPLELGQRYYLSHESGICTFAEVSGYLTEIGWAQTTGQMYIDIGARSIFVNSLD